jgi:hypothetical protein
MKKQQDRALQHCRNAETCHGCCKRVRRLRILFRIVTFTARQGAALQELQHILQLMWVYSGTVRLLRNLLSYAYALMYCLMYLFLGLTVCMS